MRLYSKRVGVTLYFQKGNRSKFGFCNICGKESELTWDHVPPKFANNSTSKDYALLLGLSSSSNNYMPLTTQNGVKYRSICSDCNNRLLGSESDPAYKEVVGAISAKIEQLQHPNSSIQFCIEADINRLARAVIGHLLAAKNFYDDQCLVDMYMREFFLNQQYLPPTTMELLYFLYPYNTIQIVRDVVPVSLDKTNIPQGMISCLYSYPIAFLLADRRQSLSLPNLFDYCTSNISDRAAIPLSIQTLYFPNTRVLRHQFWPCNVSDEIYSPQGLLGGQAMSDNIIAKNK